MKAVSGRSTASLVIQHGSPEYRSCEVVSVSGLIAAHGLERIDLLKIDVEGDELQVLQGVAQQDWGSIKQVVRVIVVLGVVIIVRQLRLVRQWELLAVGTSLE